MLKKEVLIGVTMMTVSAVLFAVTWSFPIEGQYVSPRVFPRFVTACMFVLAGILVFRSLRSSPAADRGARERSELGMAADIWQFIVRNRLFFIFAIVAFTYTRIIDRLGFITSTLALLAITVFLFKERRWTVIAAVSIIGTSVFYYLFRHIFKVPLPRFDLF